MTGQPRRGMVLAIILMGYLLVLIDVSILMVALPRIHHDLGFSSSNLSWAQNAYTLTFGGLLLLGARAGDLLGRRRTFMLGIAIFMVASAAVGCAQSPGWMIAARALQGVGAAALAPSTLALLSTSFPAGPQRTRAMAAYGALTGIGTALGLILGGALTQWWSWRIGFFINVPVGLVAILAAPRFIDETDPHDGHLDVTAAITSTAGVSALVFGIVHSANAGWSDPITLLALVVGIVLVGVFVLGQRTAAQPIMPLRLFEDPARAGAYAARFLFNGALVSFFFFMTQYLQGVSGDQPLTAGLAFMPVTAAAFLAAAATSRLTGRLSTGLMASLGCAAMLAGTAWISLLSPTTGYLGGLAVPMVIFGIGQGLGLSTLTTAGMAGVKNRDASVAGGLVNVSHHLGGAVGLGILTTLFVAAGGHQTGRALLSSRVSASLTGAAVLLALALTVTVVSQLATRRGRSLSKGDATAHAVREYERAAPEGDPSFHRQRRTMKITRSSLDTTQGPSDSFTGIVFVDAVAAPEAPARAGAGNVHFTPGARTHWHTHPFGQTIFVTEGVGRCQREGGPVQELRPGDRVFFEPGENHWHGAAPNRFMVHLAITEADENGPVTWGDPVSDEDYTATPAA